jgi:hypothetical protein
MDSLYFHKEHSIREQPFSIKMSSFLDKTQGLAVLQANTSSRVIMTIWVKEDHQTQVLIIINNNSIQMNNIKTQYSNNNSNNSNN